MAESALCGPSTPLQGLQKHAAVDRASQQDRLAARHQTLQVSMCLSLPMPFVKGLYRGSDHLLAQTLASWIQNLKPSNPASLLRRNSNPIIS